MSAESPPPATKIVASVAVILVGLVAGGIGLYYGTMFRAGPTSSPCSNGATNPPACGSFPPCQNGGTNPPQCNLFSPCTNGANNPPYCNQYPPCNNGTSNPPQCNVFNSRISLTCTPTPGFYSGEAGNMDGPFGASCKVTVSDTTIPTGTVKWFGSWTMQNAWSIGPCTLNGTSGSTSQCGSQLTPPQAISEYQSLVSVYASYQGDATHLPLPSEPFTLSAPSKVNLVGSFHFLNPCLGCRVTGINFTTGQVTNSVIPTGSLGGPYSFAIALPNLKTYTITDYWIGQDGAVRSHASYMDLYQFSRTASAAFAT